MVKVKSNDIWLGVLALTAGAENAATLSALLARLHDTFED